MFTVTLLNNGGGADSHRKHRSTIVARVFVSAGTCLPNCCLEASCTTPLFYCCVRVLLSTAVSVAHPFLHGANTP
jgi:hypothetical protein